VFEYGTMALFRMRMLEELVISGAVFTAMLMV
jgi:hypothetical protein